MSRKRRYTRKIQAVFFFAVCLKLFKPKLRLNSPVLQKVLS